ncbi:hypothetical protein Salpa_4738 [Sporomusa sp. KB1]|nr:hypothetical protein Salpa_4738 [Sporomusa sp. KB1]
MMIWMGNGLLRNSFSPWTSTSHRRAVYLRGAVFYYPIPFNTILRIGIYNFYCEMLSVITSPTQLLSWAIFCHLTSGSFYTMGSQKRGDEEVIIVVKKNIVIVMY